MNIHTYRIPPHSISENKFWHVAAFPRPSVKDADDIIQWCFQTYGPPGFNGLTQLVRWKSSICYGEIIFSKESDLTMFLLRWS